MSDFTNKANEFVADVNALNKFVNGDTGTVVTLPNGQTVSSMRKMANDAVSYLNDPGNHYTKAEMPGVIYTEVRNHVMQKTFYIDAVNGNDNNDGSYGAPFKTIKKACDSVPVGGYGHITLKSDVDVNDTILLANKALTIDSLGHNLNIKAYDDGSDNYYYGFRLMKSSVNIGSAINLDGKSDSSLPWHSGALASVFKGYHPAGVNFIRLTGNINMPADAGTLCSSGMGNWAIITHLLFEGATIIRDGGVVYSIQSGGSGVGSISTYNTSLKDSAGNTLSWVDVITGVVKDANGVPRNINSNIIL